MAKMEPIEKKVFVMWCPFPKSHGCPKRTAQLGGSFPDIDCCVAFATNHGRNSTYHMLKNDEATLQSCMDSLQTQEDTWDDAWGDYESWAEEKRTKTMALVEHEGEGQDPQDEQHEVDDEEQSHEEHRPHPYKGGKGGKGKGKKGKGGKGKINSDGADGDGLCCTYP